MRMYLILYYSFYISTLVNSKEFTDLAMYCDFAQKAIYYIYLSKITIEYFDKIYNVKLLTIACTKRNGANK